jgi:uncharacterized membrane protein YgdD (TMEM256/DUF423 family)
MILSLGAILGFISVAFGAYAEHGLKDSVTTEHFSFLMTAIRYNQINAVIISAIGLAVLTDTELAKMLILKLSGLLFVIGTILFSFSIYLSVVLDVKWLVNITPIGGMTIMIAWVFLMATGLYARRKL